MGQQLWLLSPLSKVFNLSTSIDSNNNQTTLSSSQTMVFTLTSITHTTLHPLLNSSHEESLMRMVMVLRTTKSWINTPLINSERLFIAPQLRTCITPITEKCQDTLDSETHPSQESTHGLLKWPRRRLSTKEELLKRKSFKISKLADSPAE